MACCAMSPPDLNPETRSNNAILCLCIGAGLVFLAWLFGVGGALSAALAGGLAGAAMGMLGALALIFAASSGAVLMAIGGVWMLIRVIADQRGEASEKRYRDVQR